MNNATPLTDIVRQRFPQHVLGTHRFRGQETVLLKREGLRETAGFLKDSPDTAFDFLIDLTCVDYKTFGTAQRSAPTLATPSPLPYYMNPKPVAERWERLPAPPSGGAHAGFVDREAFRFDVVYHVYSSRHNHRLRVKVPLTESDPMVDSLSGLWRGANWFEREVWDMFGVRFAGHPNLKRLLMYEEFVGHPLRKDYPVHKRQPLIGPIN